MSERKSPRKIFRIVSPAEAAEAEEDSETEAEVLSGEVQNMEFAMGDSAESVVRLKIIPLPGTRAAEAGKKRATRGKKPQRYMEEAGDGDHGDVVENVQGEKGTNAEDGEGPERKPAKRKTVHTLRDGDEEGGEVAEKRARSTGVRANKRGVPENMRSEEEKTCHTCNKVFDTYRQFRFHAKDAHKECKCPHCDQALYSKTTLQKHIWAKHREHANGQAPEFPCRYCDKVWSSNSSRFSHEATHKQRRFECSTCKQLFFNGYTRKQHELTHSDEAVRCSFCKRLFESATVFADHLQRHHPEEMDTHGAGIWNVGRARKAKLRGSKVEREIGVVIAEYENENENEEECVSEPFERMGDIRLIPDPAYQSTVEALIPENQVGGTKRKRRNVFRAQVQQTDPENGAMNVVDEEGDGSKDDSGMLIKDASLSVHKAVIKCRRCDTSCFDGDAMIAHLLSSHPDLLQVKLL